MTLMERVDRDEYWKGSYYLGRSITGAEGSACAGTRFPTAQTGNGHTGEPEQLFHISWRFLHLISAGR